MPAAEPTRTRIAANRARQCELYGAPLGDRVRALTSTLGISQARLAGALGISPPMLSQLVSARRVKIGDPAVLARLRMLGQRCHGWQAPPAPRVVEALLAEVAKARFRWATDPPSVDAGVPVPAQRPRPGGPAGAAEALRRVAEPARLAAAAAALGRGFPELAEVLRQAAARPAGG